MNVSLSLFDDPGALCYAGFAFGYFGEDLDAQVWCADVTYIPMAKGFLYLVVIMDWVSRAVLAWRLSTC